MDRNSRDFRDLNMDQMAQLAQSEAARQLFAMLGGNENPLLRSAVSQAAAGDMTQAQTMLQQLMEDPKARALVQQIMGGANG